MCHVLTSHPIMRHINTAVPCITSLSLTPIHQLGTQKLCALFLGIDSNLPNQSVDSLCIKIHRQKDCVESIEEALSERVR